MYGPSSVVTSTAAAGGSLAYTGLSMAWVALAAFALFAAGIAILRIAPRKEA